MRLIEKIQTSVISWAKANLTRLRGITCMQKNSEEELSLSYYRSPCLAAA